MRSIVAIAVTYGGGFTDSPSTAVIYFVIQKDKGAAGQASVGHATATLATAAAAKSFATLCHTLDDKHDEQSDTLRRPHTVRTKRQPKNKSIMHSKKIVF
jgi:hypothetical protein